MMKRRFYGISLLIAALAALALGGPARAGEQVPFKGRSSGVVTVVGFDPVAGIASTHVEGEGVATHLGRFTLTADATVAVNLPGGPAAGSWTLTAANGDQLFVTFVASGIDPTHGIGDFTIEGGTGRFQGATGSYTQLIEFATPPGSTPSTAYTDVLAGWISSPGSNK
jgi:hypothetical protein